MKNYVTELAGLLGLTADIVEAAEKEDSLGARIKDFLALSDPSVSNIIF